MWTAMSWARLCDCADWSVFLLFIWGTLYVLWCPFLNCYCFILLFILYFVCMCSWNIFRKHFCADFKFLWYLFLYQHFKLANMHYGNCPEILSTDCSALYTTCSISYTNCSILYIVWCPPTFLFCTQSVLFWYTNCSTSYIVLCTPIFLFCTQSVLFLYANSFTVLFLTQFCVQLLFSFIHNLFYFIPVLFNCFVQKLFWQICIWKQCRLKSHCSFKSSLIRVNNVCYSEKYFVIL